MATRAYYEETVKMINSKEYSVKMAFWKLLSEMEDHNSDQSSETLHRNGDSSLYTEREREEFLSLKQKQEQYYNKTAQMLPQMHVNMKVYVQLQPQSRD